MSNFRSKAQEVYAQGVEERGNFTPTGTPLKVYQWWASRSRNAPDRENFCHFWRVVAIWAPLMWLREKGNAALDNRVVQIVTLVAVLVALAYAVVTIHSASIVALCVAGAVYVLTGLATGVFAAFPESEVDEDWQVNRTWLWVIFALTLPVAVIGFIGGKISRAWTDKWTERLLYGLMTIAVLWGVGMLVMGIIEGGWIVLLWLALFVAGVVVFIAGISGLVTFLSGRRVKRRAAQRDAARQARLDAPDDFEPSEPREPGRVAKFFTGLLDFLILTGQIIRVKKWKICPTVEVPKEV